MFFNSSDNYERKPIIRAPQIFPWLGSDILSVKNCSWLLKWFQGGVIALICVSRADAVPDTFHSDQLFQGRGGVSSITQNINTEVIDELNFPTTLSSTKENLEAVAIMENGRSLIFNRSIDTGLWQVSSGFSLPNDYRQHLTMSKHPNLDVIYIGAEKDKTLHTVKRNLGQWILNEEEKRLENDVLDGLQSMSISSDGRYLATTSSKGGNVSIRTLSSWTGAVEDIDTIWAHQEGESGMGLSGTGLKGAWGLDFHPQSNELAVTGNHANSIQFFRHRNGRWVQHSVLDKQTYGAYQYIHGPTGVAYSETGDYLAVAMKKAHAVLLIDPVGDDTNPRINQLIISDKVPVNIEDLPLHTMVVPGIVSPEKIWFIGDRLYIGSKSGTVVLAGLENNLFTESYPMGSDEYRESKNIRNIVRTGDFENANSLAVVDKAHRVSFMKVYRAAQPVTVVSDAQVSTVHHSSGSIKETMSLMMLFMSSLFTVMVR